MSHDMGHRMAGMLDELVRRAPAAGSQEAADDDGSIDVPPAELSALIANAVYVGALNALKDFERWRMRRVSEAVAREDDDREVAPDPVADASLEKAVAYIATVDDAEQLEEHLVHEAVGGNRRGVMAALEVRLKELRGAAG